MARMHSYRKDRTSHHPQRARPVTAKARSVSNASIRSVSPASTVSGAKSGVLKKHRSGSSVISSRKDGKIDRQKCFDLLSEVQSEMEQEMDEHLARLNAHFQTERAQWSKRLEQLTADKDSLLARNLQAEGEVSRLKQELEIQTLAMQDQVGWSEIQPALYQAHDQLVSAATGLWNFVETIQNRHLATFLPGSGTMNYNWSSLNEASRVADLDTFAPLYNQQAPQQDQQAINQVGRTN